MPSEQELHAVRFDFDPAPSLETLMLHFCGEIRLNHWYRRAAQWHTEPVIKRIYELISRDEARHGGAYLHYMKKAIATSGDAARAAFARIGLLMASSARSRKPLHPTNLHVNKALFPHDTVQSRLPDPDWLEHWLDSQIQLRPGVGSQGGQHDPAQSVVPVRAPHRERGGAQPLPQGTGGAPRPHRAGRLNRPHPDQPPGW